MKSKLGFLVMLAFFAACGKKTVTPTPDPIKIPEAVFSKIEFWLTKADKSSLLQKQNNPIINNTASNTIEVDSSQAFQTIDGFGYTLTGSSAYLINNMPITAKNTLLQELFGKNDNSISVNYLRISMGSSDLDLSVFSYNDITEREDLNLEKFTIKPDQANLIPVLKEILKINPKVKLMATPWSAPAWMKSNGITKDGNLLTKYYESYAKYFVKYIQAYKAEGIDIEAITIQNEPLNGNNNPSMVMTDMEQAEFVKTNLGPAFEAANLKTKLVIYDHNADKPNYPINILNDAKARKYIDGSAFHLYAGDITAMNTVHNSHPDKNLYFTEQYTGSKGDFGGDLKWHLKNVMIGSMRNWSKVALEWNLANDPNFGLYTPGGCTECKGAITIEPSGLATKNVSFYIVGHLSKFVPFGSKRISSTSSNSSLQNVAFITPDGKKVLIVENDGMSDVSFNIKQGKISVVTTLQAGSVGSYIW